MCVCVGVEGVGGGGGWVEYSFVTSVDLQFNHRNQCHALACCFLDCSHLCIISSRLQSWTHQSILIC